MRTFKSLMTTQYDQQNDPALTAHQWLIAVIFTIAVIVLAATTAGAHGAPIIDGLYTGDWCAPAAVLAYGPDSLTTLTPLGPPPVLCPLGSEIFWDDWDSINYGPPDTMGWLIGGVPGAPAPDFEVDIDFFATTADAATVFFTVQLGPFPSTTGIPPHVQIAIDTDGAVTGNPFWYDPIPSGTLPMGVASIPAPIFADYLITTDGPAGFAQVWEATTAPGAWTPAGPPIPLAWSGAFAAGPSVFEVAVPWPNFFPGPPFALGVPATMTIMTAHGVPAPGSPPTSADAPMTPEEDVFTEIGAGFTFSPDLCPPGPVSTDCEIYFPPPPGFGVGTSDGYISVFYPTADLAITKTNGTSTVVPGAPVTYTITASNPTGPSIVTGAMVNDTFPPALTGCTWTCIGTPGGVCSPAGVGNIADIVNLGVGDNVTYTATCTLSTSASGSLSNTAAIAAPVGVIELNPLNDSATDIDTIATLDFGDAPDPTYPTLLASNGARHGIVGPFLGATVDADTNGQPSPLADGDDLDGNDDEDGVVFTSAVVAGLLSTVSVTASGPGLLDAWIDFNTDGDWNDAGEQIFSSVGLIPGANALVFVPPASTQAGTTFARFRISQSGGLSPFGLAVDGEVEDEMVTVTRSADLAMSKTDSRDPVVAGLSLDYTLTTTNHGPSDAGGITVTDTLPGSVTFTSVVPGSPTCTESSGTVTCNLGQLASTTSTDVVITVLVDSSAAGTLSNTATVSATEPDPSAGNDSDSESTAIVIPLFADGFESGDDTGWDNSRPESILVATGPGEPTGEIWATFRLDDAILNRLRPAAVVLAAGTDHDNRTLFRIATRGEKEETSVRAFARRDDGSWADTGWRVAEALEGQLELHWRRALKDINDGILELRHNGVLVLELTNLDNDLSALINLKRAEVDGRPILEELKHR